MATDDRLWAAIRAAHEQWSPETAERFPPPPEWEPAEAEARIESGEVGEVEAPASTGPVLPEHFGRQTRAERLAEERAVWEERAAILEYDGGLSREEAERQTAEELGYRERTPVTRRQRY